jgi:C1A family cysteine protease
MRTLFFAVLLGLVALSVAIPVGRAQDEFRNWMQQYNKQYETDAEFQHRFEVFLQNKQRVAQMNRAKPADSNVQWGVTKFMDLTPEEFKKFYLGTRVTETDNKPAPIDIDKLQQSLPTTFDWRSSSSCISAVKNQGNCGSCWAFSTTEGTESAYCISTGKLYTLAPQELVSCDNTCDGCGGGEVTAALNYVERYGLEGESSYPYTSGNSGQNGKCTYNSADVEATVTSWGYSTQSKNETAMQVSMYSISPLAVVVDAQSWQFYKGGVVTSNCGTNLDHAVQAVGWNEASSTPYWIVRNSWGADWGEQGYIWVEMFKNMCGIASQPLYVEYKK